MEFNELPHGEHRKRGSDTILEKFDITLDVFQATKALDFL